jgi:hypothetical protein
MGEHERDPRRSKIIYRKWSLLSSTVVIWGGVATAGLAGIFLLGSKVLPSVPIPGSG